MLDTTQTGSERILIAEDDEFFRDVMKSVLERKGYTVDTAPDGQSARHLLTLRRPDLVISDIRMPRMDGVELLKCIKNDYRLPVILMTGFADILETQNAADLGADDFLPKPFEDSDLFSAIASCLSPAGGPSGGEEAEEASAAEPVRSEPEYYRVPLRDFVYGRHMPFTIHVKLHSGRYVKVAYSGEDISRERIHTYEARGLKYLYVTREDFHRAIGFNLDLGRAVKSARHISREKKQNFMRYTGELILEKAFVHGVDEESFESAREYVETAVSVLVDDPLTFNLIDTLNRHADFLYAHSLAVSMFSVMIGKKMGWHSPQTVFKLSTAGIYHDIGKKEIDREILDKPRPSLNATERQKIEAHPSRGREILGMLRSIPGDIPEIVYQHHENVVGTGFPLGLRRGRIHPMARVIAVADVFCNYAVKGPQSPGLSGQDAVAATDAYHRSELDSEAYLALRALFGM